MYVKAAQMTIGNKPDSIRFLKEITQQLVNAREEMIMCLGNEAVKEISELKLKVRKIRKVKEFTTPKLKKLRHN